MSENSGEMPSPDSLKLEINAGKIGVEPHSQASMIGESKIETLETQRAKRMRRLGGVRGKLVAAGLGVVVGASGMGILSNKDSHAVDTNGQDNRSSAGDTVIANNESDQTPIPTANEAPETERSIYEKEIEDKYGIELLNQREGYERIGKEYDEENEELMGHRPVVRWSMNQLMNIDEAIAQFPPDFFPEVDGKKFAITLWDYPESEGWGGLAHWSHNMVSLSENTFGSGTNLGILAHEGAHVKDLLVNDGDLGKKATEIIGYNSFKDARLHFKPILDELYAKKLIPGLTYSKLDYGFMGYEGKGMDAPTEFIAVLAEKYIEGLEEFKDLIELFGQERTIQLYDFIKKEVYGGREYIENEKLDENQKYLTSVGIKELNEKHNYDIINESENRISLTDVNNLAKILEIMPPDFFDTDGSGKKFRIILKDTVEGVARNDPDNDVIITPDALRQKDPSSTYIYQLDAVRDINSVLIRRLDELQGNRLQIKLVNLLGGEDIFKNPEKYFPKMIERNKKGEIIKNRFVKKDGTLRSPGKILSNLSNYYLNGDYTWSRDTFLFGDKSQELYKLMKEIYGGREYDGKNGYAPIPEVKS